MLQVRIGLFQIGFKIINGFRYGIDEGCQGGWCLPCILFLSQSEKSSLGVLCAYYLQTIIGPSDYLKTYQERFSFTIS